MISLIMESIEQHLKKRIEEGYIDENLHPLKCECGGTEFKKTNEYYGEGYLEEYSLQCVNEDCETIVGNWSFGHWQL